jgi:hypothetical protein
MLNRRGLLLSCGAWTAVVGFAPIAYAQFKSEKAWRWVWVVPDETKGWRTFEGDAPVEMKAGHFEVTLEGVSADWQPTLKLVGSITGKRAVATGTLLNSDASIERYIGTVERVRTAPTDPSQGWGSDRIILRAGQSFIGLYRATKTK